ncbi:probable chitinase 10 isoform X6 [Diabrotica undecimpunctata]|uniref:probable chitinase 10 isoform X6 n=1 Tax=Diabrotica undecimpunctata TaxID=50387 RepID=UPI003B634620
MLLINFMTNRYILRSETRNMLRLNGSFIWVLVVLMQGALGQHYLHTRLLQENSRTLDPICFCTPRIIREATKIEKKKLIVSIKGLMTAVTFAPSKSPNLSCDTEYAYYPDPNDCSAFYQCIGGIKQHMECVFPLLWDNHIQGCEEESDCSQVISTTSGELTSTQVVSTTSLGPTFTQVISTTSGELTSTSICEDGDVTHDIQSCQMFYCCENNQWSGPKKCPSSLYWSENRKGCVKYSESDCTLTTTKYKMYY